MSCKASGPQGERASLMLPRRMVLIRPNRLMRALEEAELRGRWEAVLVRELAELYRHRIGSPARAAPLLSRFADGHEGTPEGEWAREELADIKRLMAEDAE